MSKKAIYTLTGVGIGFLILMIVGFIVMNNKQSKLEQDIMLRNLKISELEKNNQTISQTNEIYAQNAKDAILQSENDRKLRIESEKRVANLEVLYANIKQNYAALTQEGKDKALSEILGKYNIKCEVFTKDDKINIDKPNRWSLLDFIVDADKNIIKVVEQAQTITLSKSENDSLRTANSNLNAVILGKDAIIGNKDGIIANKDIILNDTNKLLKIEKRKKTWYKVVIATLAGGAIYYYTKSKKD